MNTHAATVAPPTNLSALTYPLETPIVLFALAVTRPYSNGTSVPSIALRKSNSGSFHLYTAVANSYTIRYTIIS